MVWLSQNWLWGLLGLAFISLQMAGHRAQRHDRRRRVDLGAPGSTELARARVRSCPPWRRPGA